MLEERGLSRKRRSPQHHEILGRRKEAASISEEMVDQVQTRGIGEKGWEALLWAKAGAAATKDAAAPPQLGEGR